MAYPFKFEYEATGTVDDGMSVSRSGQGQTVMDIGPNDYVDDGMIYGRALECVIDDFWTFAVEKPGYHTLSEVTISIRNLSAG